MVTPQSHDSHIVPESSSSSTRLIINNNNNMSSINGKAPINGGDRVIEPIIKVQPPRREDLQPSYARVIQPDDQDAGSDGAGWYGTMVCLSVARRFLT
jgi:erythrocyte band 7 integral membrane protein